MKPLLAAAVLLGASAAAAQAPPTPTTPPPQTAPPSSRDCAPTQARPQDGTVAPAPRDGTTGQGGETLGDRLSRSDGTLCPPPDVDPQMRAPAPDVGNTPVIPPPGSPGGDPTVRPK